MENFKKKSVEKKINSLKIFCFTIRLQMAKFIHAFRLNSLIASQYLGTDMKYLKGY